MKLNSEEEENKVLNQERDKLVDIAFNVNQYFHRFLRRSTLVAAPFYVTAKLIRRDCIHCFEGKKDIGINAHPMYCNLPEHVDWFSRTHCQITGCENCEHFSTK